MGAPDICEIVGARIRSLREKRGWTQQMLADHASLSREHINKIENGEAEPGLRALYRIAASLEISLGKLLNSD